MPPVFWKVTLLSQFRHGLVIFLRYNEGISKKEVGRVASNHAMQAAGRRTRRRTRRRRWPILLLLLCLGLTVSLLRNREAGSDGVPEDLEQYAATLGLTLSDYPAQLVDLYERNPETRDFVFEYPEKQGEHPEIDLSGCLDGGVPLLMQWDQRWGYESYAGDFFGLTGCGPTCLSMVAIYLTGDSSLSPAWAARYAADNGYATWNHGTEWALFSEGGPALGFSVQELPLDEGTIRSNLEDGHPVVCILGPGDFTATGHFVVMTGWEDGGIRLNDPNSRENSEKLWPYEDIAGQIRNLWAFQI